MPVLDVNLSIVDVLLEQCTQCEYVTSWRSALRAHMKTHRGLKSNICKQCDFASYKMQEILEDI